MMSPAYASIKTTLCSAKTSSLQTNEDSSTLMTRPCRGRETEATPPFPPGSQEPTFDELYFGRVKRKIFDLFSLQRKDPTGKTTFI